MTVPVFPDAESALLYALVPLEPDVRFCTVLPADIEGIVCRVHRISGANRDIGLDRPIVDIDVYGASSQAGNVSAAARNIQSDMLSLMSAQVTNGVITRIITISGPRQVTEANPGIVRYSATYEMTLHS